MTTTEKIVKNRVKHMNASKKLIIVAENTDAVY